ncbi:ROK family protein [Paralimibaculum aggregatum]|uniref:ROK family protein n=1 Tax=Paralimibaculum aggregatum TaxID=3036245 RepID=A0ABQ6LJX5_9RHOB|nr:ROK family protein [Limibaculum sp. NKW23]GMG82721.1 ROK family protein [Limibaculum sp. NKW23]
MTGGAAAGRWRLGVDLGGTKIEIAALDESGGAVLRRRVPSPGGSSAADYAAVIRTIAALVAGAEAELGPALGVGLGVPGSPSPATGLMRNANTTCLNGRPLAADLAAALGRPVRLENDANCFALAEARAGAGQGADPVFGAILGTGTGGGVVIGGRLLGGASGIAGEWGHMPLPAPRDDERPGPGCYCGRRGCVETWVSGPGLARDHAATTGVRLSAAAIAAAARAGDAGAAASLARHLDRLARSFGPVVNILDPEVIVLGGGVSQLPGLAGRLEAALKPHVFSDAPAVRVLPAALGDSAGVIGAAWLVALPRG